MQYVYRSVVVCLIATSMLVIANCSDNSTDVASTDTVPTDTTQSEEVSMVKTGSGVAEVEWYIEDVKRLDTYYDRNFELVEGDAVRLLGYAISNAEAGLPAFDLLFLSLKTPVEMNSGWNWSLRNQ